MIINLLSKNKFFLSLFIYLFLCPNSLIAIDFREFEKIKMISNRCFQNSSYCYKSISEIHFYQKNAVRNKNFPCQTRLLGLEANLVMAMNNNFKKKEAKDIIDAVKKYC